MSLGKRCIYELNMACVLVPYRKAYGKARWRKMMGRWRNDPEFHKDKKKKKAVKWE